MRRTGIGCIVSVLVLAGGLLVGGCVASGDDDAGPGEAPPPEPLVSLDAFGAAGIRAERVRPEPDRNLYLDTRGGRGPRSLRRRPHLATGRRAAVRGRAGRDRLPAARDR